MGSRVGRDTAPDIVDPACVQDTFVDGGIRIEDVGTECVRYTLLAKRRNEAGELVLLVVSRLIYPRGLASAVNRQSRDFLSGATAISFDMPDMLSN